MRLGRMGVGKGLRPCETCIIITSLTGSPHMIIKDGEYADIPTPTGPMRLHRYCHGKSRGVANRLGCRHGPTLLLPPPLPARDHPARDLAVSSLHPELPRCRGPVGRARARYLLRNGAALGAEIWSRDRAALAPASPSAERSLASRRDGGADRRQADVTVACGQSRGRGPRHAGAAPTRQPGGTTLDAQAAQEARLRTEIASHR